MDAIHRSIHQLLFDLRRMAPWVLAYVAFLAWRAAGADSDGMARSTFSTMVQELALILLLGGLVLENPLFSRRAFWRTRPLGAGSFLAARLLFAAVALWLPRVAAQLFTIRSLGLEPGTLWWLVVIDVTFSQALLITTLLVLVSLCRRSYGLGLVVVFALFFLWRLDQMLRGPISFRTGSPIERYLAHGVLALGVAAALGLLLAGLYRRRRVWMAGGGLGVLVAAYAAVPIASAISAPFSAGTVVEAPEDLELEVSRADQPLSYSDRTTFSVALTPSNLDPEMGLQLSAIEGELITPGGEVLEARGQWYTDPCNLPSTILERWPSLGNTLRGPTVCSSQLVVPLFNSPTAGEPPRVPAAIRPPATSPVSRCSTSCPSTPILSW